MTDWRPDPMNYMYYTNAFSDEEIDKIIELSNELPGQSGTLEGGGVDSSMRRSEIKWFLRDNPKYQWLYDKLKLYVDNANESLWRFDITGYQEAIQFTTYHAHNQGKYDFHPDIGGATSHRKISVTVQLTDPSEYDGGDLSFFKVKEPELAPRLKGTVVVFPSYLIHRVSPVTRGIRRSLVVWLAGPRFK